MRTLFVWHLKPCYKSRIEYNEAADSVSMGYISNLQTLAPTGT